MINSDKYDEIYLTNYDKFLKEKNIRLAPRYVPVTNKCWMCGGTGKKNKEHVIPLWLQQHFKCEKEVQKHFHVSALGDKLHSRTISLNKTTFGGICEKCNGEWMSDLETSFRNSFLSGWENNFEQDHILFARWIAKTATIINLSQFSKIQIPEHARHGLSKIDKLPEGWKIYLYKCEDDPICITWSQGCIPYILKNKITTEEISSISNMFFCCSIRIMNFIGVAFWTPPGKVFHLEPIVEGKELWPNNKGDLTYSPYGIQLNGRCYIDLENDKELWVKQYKKLQKIRVGIKKEIQNKTTNFKYQSS